MAELDYTINQLLRKKPYFADLINGGVFGGEQVLKEEDLELIPDQTGMLYIDQNGVKQTLQRYRDVVMKASFGTYFAILACETQNKEDYAMPVRTMVYDSLNYLRQLEEIENEHKKHGELKKSEELLSGITKEDRLTPVISVVLYLGNDWDGNKSLYDMIGVNDETMDMELIRKYLPNYHINLIQANKIEDLEQFKTDLQYVFGVLKYNTKKTLLYDYVKENREAFRQMDTDALMAMWSLMGEQKRLQKLMSEEKGEVKNDMSKAIDDLIADGEARGEIRGEARGKEQGIAEGERRFSDLILLLTKQNRQDLVLKVASDEKLRRRLYQEYHIS